MNRCSLLGLLGRIPLRLPCFAACGLALFLASTSADARAAQDSGAEGAAEQGAAAPDLPTLPDVDPAALRPKLAQPSVALEVAAYLAQGGDAEGARDTLRAVDAASADEALRERVAQELERVDAWIATRDRFLEQLVAEGKKLVVADGDKRRRLELERVADGQVHFADNRWGITSVRVTDLDPLELAREMGSKKHGFDAGRVRLYMYALCGDKRWKGLLKGDEPDVEALRVAGEIEYPAWVLRGRVHVALLELSETPAPTDAATGKVLLARIRELVTSYAGRGELEAARATLADLAARAQYSALASGRFEELFEGAVTPLDEGRVRLTYTFDDPEVLRDFDLGRYPMDGNGFEPNPDANGMRIEEGALIAEGHACLRTLATFEGPIAARYRYATISPVGGLGMTLGVHDAGDGNMLRAVDAMIVWWADPDRDPPAGSKVHDGSISFRTNVDYEIGLAIDEEGKVTLTRGDETFVELDDCPRERGAVFLGVEDDQGGKFRVRELVIEGKLTDDARERLRLLRATRVGDELRTP